VFVKVGKFAIFLILKLKLSVWSHAYQTLAIGSRRFLSFHTHLKDYSCRDFDTFYTKISKNIAKPVLGKTCRFLLPGKNLSEPWRKRKDVPQSFQIASL
jgi:hypothetical protein